MVTPYDDITPPEGADPIDYALHRYNRAIEPIILRDDGRYEVLMVAPINGTDTNTVVTIRQKKDPYDDRNISELSASETRIRTIRYKRFSVQEVLDAKLGTVGNVPPNQIGVINYLRARNIAIVDDDNAISIQDGLITITCTNPYSLFWYGTGSFVANTEVVEGFWNPTVNLLQDTYGVQSSKDLDKITLDLFGTKILAAATHTGKYTKTRRLMIDVRRLIQTVKANRNPAKVVQIGLSLGVVEAALITGYNTFLDAWTSESLLATLSGENSPIVTLTISFTIGIDGTVALTFSSTGGGATGSFPAISGPLSTLDAFDNAYEEFLLTVTLDPSNVIKYTTLVKASGYGINELTPLVERTVNLPKPYSSIVDEGIGLTLLVYGSAQSETDYPISPGKFLTYMEGEGPGDVPPIPKEFVDADEGSFWTQHYNYSEDETGLTVLPSASPVYSAQSNVIWTISRRTTALDQPYVRWSLATLVSIATPTTLAVMVGSIVNITTLTDNLLQGQLTGSVQLPLQMTVALVNSRIVIQVGNYTATYSPTGDDIDIILQLTKTSNSVKVTLLIERSDGYITYNNLFSDGTTEVAELTVSTTGDLAVAMFLQTAGNTRPDNSVPLYVYGSSTEPDYTAIDKPGDEFWDVIENLDNIDMVGLTYPISNTPLRQLPDDPNYQDYSVELLGYAVRDRETTNLAKLDLRKLILPIRSEAHDDSYGFTTFTLSIINKISVDMYMDFIANGTQPTQEEIAAFKQVADIRIDYANRSDSSSVNVTINTTDIFGTNYGGSVTFNLDTSSSVGFPDELYLAIYKDVRGFFKFGVIAYMQGAWVLPPAMYNQDGYDTYFVWSNAQGLDINDLAYVFSATSYSYTLSGNYEKYFLDPVKLTELVTPAEGELSYIPVQQDETYNFASPYLLITADKFYPGDTYTVVVNQDTTTFTYDAESEDSFIIQLKNHLINNSSLVSMDDSWAYQPHYGVMLVRMPNDVQDLVTITVTSDSSVEFTAYQTDSGVSNRSFRRIPGGFTVTLTAPINTCSITTLPLNETTLVNITADCYLMEVEEGSYPNSTPENTLRGARGTFTIDTYSTYQITTSRPDTYLRLYNDPGLTTRVPTSFNGVDKYSMALEVGTYYFDVTTDDGKYVNMDSPIGIFLTLSIFNEQ